MPFWKKTPEPPKPENTAPQVPEKKSRGKLYGVSLDTHMYVGASEYRYVDPDDHEKTTARFFAHLFASREDPRYGKRIAFPDTYSSYEEARAKEHPQYQKWLLPWLTTVNVFPPTPLDVYSEEFLEWAKKNTGWERKGDKWVKAASKPEFVDGDMNVIKFRKD